MKEVFHLLATLAKLIGPGGGRTIIAENLLLKTYQNNTPAKQVDSDSLGTRFKSTTCRIVWRRYQYIRGRDMGKKRCNATVRIKSLAAVYDTTGFRPLCVESGHSPGPSQPSLNGRFVPIAV